jgi:hypothetical protein
MRGVIPFFVVGSLIMMVVIIILSGILLMRVFSWTKDTVVYFFGGFFSPPTPLEKALICYYHICANTGVGCRHPNVDKWCRDIEVLSLINYEEICSLPSALKVDGEQCRKAYWQFPLRINLNEPQEVRVKTLRSKRNVDSGKEYVFLLRPTGGGGKVYSDSRFASFTIGNSVNLVNFVNEENTPYSCPEGNICLESATVDKSSYEISGIIYKKGGIYVPVGTGGSFSAYYSFYSSGQSYEVKVDFEGGRGIFGNERLLRISVDAEKKEGDQPKDYNYILNLSSPYQSIIDGCNLYISFWGGGVDSTSSYSCKITPTSNNCKNSEVSFKTRGGNIRVTIKDAYEGRDEYDISGATCYVRYVELNITYEAHKALPVPPPPSTPSPPPPL